MWDMRRKIFLFFTCVALAVIASGQLNNQHKRPLVIQHIDSLLTIGQSMDSGPVRMRGVSEQALALAKKMDYKKGIIHAAFNISLSEFYQSKFLSSYKILDSLLTELSKDSLTYSKAFDYNKAKSKIFCLMAIIFDETEDYEKALDCYLLALQLIENSKESYDKALIYKGIGIINWGIGEYNKADYYFDLALQLSKDFKDKRIQFDIYNEKFKYYIKQKDYQNADVYSGKQHELCQNSQNIYMEVIAEKNLALVYYHQGKIELSEVYIKEILKQFRYQQFPDIIAECYLLLSKIYLDKKELTLALNTATQAYNCAMKTDLPQLEADALLSLSTIYETTGHLSKSLALYRDYHNLTDSIYEKNNRQKIIEMQFRLDMNKILREKANLADTLTINHLRSTRKTYLLYGALIFITLLIYLSLALMKKYRTEKTNYDQLENKQKVIDEQRQIIVNDQEEKFRIELEHKNRELVSYTMALTRENENKIKIVEALNKLKEKAGKEPLTCSDDIGQVINEIRQTINRNSWEEFRLYFENVYSDFFIKLEQRFPDLTRNEKKLCAFLKLNLGTKEIAAITSREIRSVESSRARLRKKFRLPSDTSFNEFLSHF
ncbi:MAG: hypothetical protein CVU06_03905 [Bacteroidetes bacterium HGW-Bacteroidetes-22]|nr:MAG: hypothetical protein CVU06_03905 [Bacteroidetes bacterium HGW-Bacteroidetes-22]